MPASPAVSPVIRVQLYARFADLLGASHVDVPASGPTTVADVLARIRSLPGGSAIGAGALVAVNLRQARPEQPVSPGDEVALLPPLAGG
ncbi:MAG TPA: MoaD/ThiS family protein [Gemmatimonadales bacterium]|jgi:molybdopterin converting factor small subunit|nr:MoaD/ThiS family protein [Gemmatimonadales bacterium]